MPKQPMPLMMPTIRMEIDRLKCAIQHAIIDYNGELENAINAELEKVIDNFDFREAILRNIAEVVDEKIREYFSYGNGSKIVKTATEEALNSIFHKGEDHVKSNAVKNGTKLEE